EELAAERMRYTLELKEKNIKQTQLEAQADKVRRETAAEAAGAEQVIAAKSQAEALKHVLPLKEKEIEEKRLEAEAGKGVGAQAGRGERRRAAHRGIRRGRLAAQARRQRRLPARCHRQGDHRADGARGRVDPEESAADPEDARRQAVRQGAGHHRAAVVGRLL